MASTRFRKGKRRSGRGGGSFKSRNLITKEGVLFVPPYLSKKEKGGSKYNVTEIRVVPPIDDEGETSPLNPDATDETPFRECLGDTFADIEVVRQMGGRGGKGICTDMITTIQDLDEEGNEVGGGWTPYNMMVGVLRKKIKQAVRMRNAGIPTDIPKHWFQWMAGKFPFPNLPLPNGEGYVKDDVEQPEQFLIKCMVRELNGTKAKDMKTGSEWRGPAVFMVPPSGAAGFFDAICEKYNDGDPLTLENNRFGDFASLKNGSPIEMSKASDGDYTLRLGRKVVPITLEQAREYDLDWEDLINIPTVEQSIEWIAEALGDKIAVAFGLFGDDDPNDFKSRYRRYIPEEWWDETFTIIVDGEEQVMTAQDIKQPMLKDDFEAWIADAEKAAKQRSGGRRSRNTADEPPPFEKEKSERSEDSKSDKEEPAGNSVDDIDEPPPGIDADRYTDQLAKMQGMVEDDDDDQLDGLPFEGDDDGEDEEEGFN